MNFYKYFTAPLLTKSFFFFCMTGLWLMTGSSCDRTPENILSHNHYDSLELAPFVEPDFPYITTSMDLRDMAPHLPQDNVVSRGIVVLLDDSTYACFDTDLLRWAVGWTGEFISLTGMAQISYDDFFNKKNKFQHDLLNSHRTSTQYSVSETKQLTQL